MQTETIQKTTPHKTPALRPLVPRVDIYDKDGDLILVADVPGTSESDVDVQMEKSSLLLVAKAEPLGVIWKRSFTLPRTIDVDKVQAVLVEGVLTLTLPRRAEDKTRRIAVTVR